MTERTYWWQGRRGEWYLVVQALLLLLLVFGPRGSEGALGLPFMTETVAHVVGGVMIAAGLTLAGSGALSLGRNLTPLPHPRDNAELVEKGAYRLVRHPIYSGIILFGYGWSIFSQGWYTLGYATLLFLFFDIKSRREERWLMEMFPGYRQYRKRVRRLIPFLY